MKNNIAGFNEIKHTRLEQKKLLTKPTLVQRMWQMFADVMTMKGAA